MLDKHDSVFLFPITLYTINIPQLMDNTNNQKLLINFMQIKNKMIAVFSHTKLRASQLNHLPVLHNIHIK